MEIFSELEDLALEADVLQSQSQAIYDAIQYNANSIESYEPAIFGLSTALYDHKKKLDELTQKVCEQFKNAEGKGE